MGKSRTETTAAAGPDAAAPEAAKKPQVLDPAAVETAIQAGTKVLADGGTKADAARAMYDLIRDEPKEVVVEAFVKGATLTEKGALTYWYNCRRKASKAQKAAADKQE